MQDRLNYCRPKAGLVLTIAGLLAACSIAGRELRQGALVQVAGQATTPQTNFHSAPGDPEADVVFGPGQPLEFYQMVFGPHDRSLGPACACFAPGTDERVMSFVNDQEMMIDPVTRYQWGGSRWSGAQGTPRSLTWSFVPDGLSISGGVGEPTSASQLFSRMDTLFGAGNRATWILRIQQCFDRWSQVCGVTYARITFGGNDWDDGASWGSTGSVNRGDIRISMHPIDGANGILAYTFFPSNGDTVFDSGENWAQTAGFAHRFLRNTLTHEHGHALGFNHVCPANGTKLMEPFLTTSYDGVRHDDVRAGQAAYGDIFENNNSAAAASNIGTLVVGTPINLGAIPPPVSGTGPANSSTMSIDANGKTDFYKFHVGTPVLASVTVTPQGLTYLNGVQNGDGSCSAGTNFNSLAVCDLAVDILSTDGTTVLGTANATGAGSAETLSSVNLPAAGDYYVKVYEVDSPTQSQLYTMSLSAASACPTITISPGTLPDAIINFPYSQQLVASGGTGPYTYAVTVGSLPAGLSLVGDTISGTPTGPSGAANFTIRATDTSSSCTGSQAYSQNIVCPTEDISPASLPNANIGQPYSQGLSGTGGIAPYTFAIISGILPSELSMDPGGLITGAPVDSIGAFGFTVRSTDSAGCTATRAYSITVVCTMLGDVNNSGTTDGLDIQGFTDCLLNGGTFPGDDCGCADINADGVVDDFDVDPFVAILVQ